MEFRLKIYQSIFNGSKLESAIDKKNLNITIIEELRSILNVSQCKIYLHSYWYNLKYFVQALHGAYRLYFKMLVIYGNSAIPNIT